MGMITPHLEKLILEGKAAFKTYTVGGGQMHRLKVNNDSYIVIVGFTHFPYLPREEQLAEDEQLNSITQMSVGGEKSYNNFVFRNSIHYAISLNSVGGLIKTLGFGEPVQIDTYLVHDSEVTFSFSRGEPDGLFANATADAPAKSTAKQTPTQYGRVGVNNAIGNIPVRTVIETSSSGTAEMRPFGDFTPATAGQLMSSQQLQYPVEAGNTAIDDLDLEGGQASFPIVLVQYVEIIGNPNNLRSNN